MKTTEKLKKYLEKIKKQDKEINSFIELRDEKELMKEAEEIDKKISSGKAGKLAGKIIGVKANINVLGMTASCASKVLENYKSTYDAIAIKKIKDEDGLIIGMCNMDEFACGASGETSAFGPTKNPINKKFITGGTSSGSAAAVAAGFCDVALGSDTGGSIRNPASHCGVVGVKPSYGAVSRYGLIDMCMSFDQIGPLTKNVEDSALLFEVIRGRDENDSISQEGIFNFKEIFQIPKGLKVGLLKIKGVEPEIQNLIENKLKEVSEKKWWNVEEVKLKHIDLAIETYYPIVYTEFFSGTRKFDGRRYVKKIEDACGPEVLRRILGGNEITKAEHGGRYYNKALKAKKIIEKEFEEAFKKFDCIVCPTVPRLPHKIGEKISVEKMYAYDVLTSPVNLAGSCAISLPIGKLKEENVELPVGMQIICNKFEEQKMFQIAKAIEEL